VALKFLFIISRRNTMNKNRSYYPALAVGVVLYHLAAPSWATTFTVTNLVTDNQAAHPAQIEDPGLLNAWGMSFSATSPFWVSSNGARTSVLYSVNPVTQATVKQGLVVTIPGAGNPTGQVFNGNAGTGAFNGDRFLFVSEDGTVSGWKGGANAETLVPAASMPPTNVYKGAAFDTMGGHSYLYATDFLGGTVSIFKGDAAAPNLAGNFTDPGGLPPGYAPFNIQKLADALYVTYALQNPPSTDELAGPGRGVVDKYDRNGNFLGRVATGGSLNAPWGLAIAPSSFGDMAGKLLVGNFGDGRINIYDPLSYASLGQVLDTSGQPVSIDGLWGISPGNDGSAGSSKLLYFTAGPDDESHGLFGVLTVPEPSTYAMTLVGILGLLIRRRAA
jgi:uncharacterized protein (TIGR03118 family)